MAVSCSKRVERSERKKEEETEKQFMDLFREMFSLPLSLTDIFIRTIRNIYLEDNRKDGVEKQDRNRVVRQFDWTSAINSERFVERESTILDGEEKTKWNYWQNDSLLPQNLSSLSISRISLQILNVCSKLPSFVSQEAQHCTTIASTSYRYLEFEFHWIKVIHLYELCIQSCISDLMTRVHSRNFISYRYLYLLEVAKLVRQIFLERMNTNENYVERKGKQEEIVCSPEWRKIDFTHWREETVVI